MQFINERARKKGPIPILHMERAKSERAALIGQETGLFYVPKMIRFERDVGALEFEYMHGLRTFLDIIESGDSLAFQLAEKAGRSLAAIHEHLLLPPEMKVDFPKEWMGLPEDNVFLHGDYTVENTCFDENTGCLVIVDWSSAPYFGRTPTFGIRYLDIAWFSIDLFTKGSRADRIRRRSSVLADYFIKGYLLESKVNINFMDMFPYLKRIYNIHNKLLLQRASARPLIRGLAFGLTECLINSRFRLYLCYRAIRKVFVLRA